jgi:hypothetical protein
MTTTDPPATDTVDAGASTAPTAPATRSSTRVRTKSARALESERTESLLQTARTKRVEREKSAVEKEGEADAGEDVGKAEEGSAEVSSVPAVVTEADSVDANADPSTGPAPESTSTSKPESEPQPQTEPQPVDEPKEGPKTRGKRRAGGDAAAAKKRRKSKYCTCHEARSGPMIQCGECADWFHFGCVDMGEDEAERIRAYFVHCAASLSAYTNTGIPEEYVCANCVARSGKTTTCKSGLLHPCNKISYPFSSFYRHSRLSTLLPHHSCRFRRTRCLKLSFSGRSVPVRCGAQTMSCR